MGGHLVWNAFNGSFFGPDSLPREGFHHFAGAFGIGDPFVVELVRARRDATVAFAGIDHPGIAAMHQLEEMVFGLSVAPRVADQHLGKLRVLDSVVFLATLAEGAAVKADDRGMTEIGVDAVK